MRTTWLRTTLAVCALTLLIAIPQDTHAAPAKKPNRARTTRSAPKTPAASAAKSGAKPPAKPEMPRTLDDVHIEGEIPVPQVLFITARDQRRYMDFQHHRYLKTSTRLGEETPFPTWVSVKHGSPIDTRKESSR